jgi:hypothetical protein
MTPERIAELRALCEERERLVADPRELIGDMFTGDDAHMWSAVPELLDENAELRAKVAELERNMNEAFLFIGKNAELDTLELLSIIATCEGRLGYDKDGPAAQLERVRSAKILACASRDCNGDDLICLDCRLSAILNEEKSERTEP